MIEEAVQIVVRGAAVFGGHALSLFSIRATDGRDLDTRDAKRRARVCVADVSSAENSDFHAMRRILMLRNHTWLP